MKYSLTILGLAAIASAQEFTSIFNITATPDQVVNAQSQPAPGQPGARGQFNYAINSKTDTICYDITLFGVSGTPQSPARTATHIHEGAVGRNGPPRIAFPNPVGDDTVRRSVGCLTGPFTTGLKGADNVTDTGAGFRLAQIEANPSGFFTDYHSNLFVPGVVRGQLGQSFVIIGAEDPSKLTTATLTSTKAVTVTKCPTTVTDCPANQKVAVVTATAVVYTTICPISELPQYKTAARTNGTVIVLPPPATKPGVPATTPVVVYTPVYTTKVVGGSTAVQGGSTVVVGGTTSISQITSAPVVGTGVPVGPTATPSIVIANGASSQKAGAFLMAAGLAAALL